MDESQNKEREGIAFALVLAAYASSSSAGRLPMVCKWDMEP